MQNHEWLKVKTLFHKAEQLPKADWSAFLERETDGDAVLTEVVLSLLKVDTEQMSFLDRPALDLSHTMIPGAMLGPYQVLRPIGSGGSATVYLAIHQGQRLASKVAVKVLKPGLDTVEILANFAKEQEIAKHLNHPYIAKYFDSGTTPDQRPYMVMEYVEGQPLTAYCQEHDLSLDQRLQLFAEICEGVHAAHQNLVIHRDLKPGNILVDQQGHPKLLDFGISKILDPLSYAPQTLTQVAERPFTLEYASPEQIRGEATTTATDLYSLGVILYELLTGSRPFTQGTLGHDRTRQAIIDRAPLPPSQASTKTHLQLRRDRRFFFWSKQHRLPKDLDNIVLKALRKDPQRRYGSCAELGQDVQRFLLGFPVQARPESFGYLCSKLIRRHALATVGSLVSLAVLIGFTALLFFQKQETIRQRDHAERISQLLLNTFEGADPYLADGKTLTAKDLLQKAVTHIGNELEDDPLAKAKLLTTMAATYKTMGDFPKAKSLLEQAQKLQKNLHRSTSLEYADTLFHLAEVYVSEHRLEEATTHFQQALTVYQQKLPENHIKVGMAIGSLAKINAQRGRLAEAYALFERAIQKLTANDSDVANVILANVLDRLGKTQSNEGRFAEAEKHLRQALALKEAHHHAHHPGIANILNNLAVLCNNQGRLEEAEHYYVRSLDLTTQAFGETNLKTISVLGNLGVLYMSRGDLEKAEIYQKRNIALLEEHYPQDRWSRVIGLNNLARVYQEAGRFAEAEPLFQQACSLSAELKGLPPIKRLPLLVNLASIYRDLGQFSKAEPLFEQGLALTKVHLKANHPAVAKLFSGWGTTRMAEDRSYEARTFFCRAFAIQVQTLSTHHPALLKNTRHLIEAFKKTDHPALADSLQQTLDLWTSTKGGSVKDLNPDLLARIKDMSQNLAVRSETVSP